MIDYQQLDKNRIRFPVKIRMSQDNLHKDLLDNDGSSKKVLRLATSQSLGTLETNSNNYVQPRIVPTYTKFASTPVASRSIKLLDQSEWIKTSFNKNNFLVLTPDVSRISKDQQTKGSQFGDFGDLSQSITLQSLRHCDNSFEESNKISIFQGKNQNEITHDSLFYQRTIEQKNNQINILIQNINEQRKVLQSRIMQLQFQNMLQKRKSSQTIEYLNNLQRICEEQQNQIKRLQYFISHLNEQKNNIILSHYSKQQQSLQTISELQYNLQFYEKQLQKSRIDYDKQKSQNNLFKDFIDSLQNQKLQLHLEFLELKMVYENEKQQTKKLSRRHSKQQEKKSQKINHSDKLNKINNAEQYQQPKINNCTDQQKEEKISFEIDVLQNEEEEQKQMFESKHKTHKRKNVIQVLQNKIKNLEEQLDCAGASNYTLFETNQQLISLALKHLCQKLQQNNVTIY